MVVVIVVIVVVDVVVVMVVVNPLLPGAELHLRDLRLAAAPRSLGRARRVARRGGAALLPRRCRCGGREHKWGRHAGPRARLR